MKEYKGYIVINLFIWSIEMGKFIGDIKIKIVVELNWIEYKRVF